MPESFSEQHLAQLEERWRRDPASRVFLQLAEELRRGGRLERAIEVLRAGLERHPGYLSAQVALGRCLFERGDHAASAEMLERAVAQDPAQLVASRLLIESYLALGDAARARSRLDFYRLFSDRDDEIRQLDARVRDLESPPPPEPPAPFGGLDLAPPPLAFAPEPSAAALDELPFGELAVPRAAAARWTAACRREGIFAVAVPAPARSAPVAVAAGAVAVEPEPIAALPEPVAVESEAPVAAEPLPWWSAPEPAVEPAPSAPEPVVETAPSLAEPAVETAPPAMVEAAPAKPAQAPAAPSAPPWQQPDAALALESEAPLFAAAFSPREIGAEVERETIEEPFDEVYSAAVKAPPAPAPAAPAASVTLAELYLEQGHLDEAERAFAAVLADRPDDRAANQGLAEVRRLRAEREAAAAWLPEAVATAPEPVAGTLSQRKAAALRQYLERLRRGAAARVS